MSWYNLFDPEMERLVALAIFAITFVLILYRRFNISYVPLIASGIIILLGIASPAEAFPKWVNWDVLAIYWGYGMLVTSLLKSNIPFWLANRILSRVKKEKYALLFLCILAMVLSSFMVNPVVVIMLAPLAIEIATRLKASLFLYLVALSVSSNVVTTVTMISDPPAIILATSTGMDFLDFYWFQGRIGLGTLSIIGISVALSTLLFQFRKLNNVVDIEERGNQDNLWAPCTFSLKCTGFSIYSLEIVGSVEPSGSGRLWPRCAGLGHKQERCQTDVKGV